LEEIGAMTKVLDSFSREEVVLTIEYVLKAMLDLAEPPPQGGGARRTETPHLNKEGARLVR
jgi:hypothetical protein